MSDDTPARRYTGWGAAACITRGVLVTCVSEPRSEDRWSGRRERKTTQRPLSQRWTCRAW